ncbi:hypothetical protein [Fastidiosibacter lacustris]|uniref:hypothetical protein n=1 Tax=Fastidiosibacter lacustris TaxID=2056695 RepID=UPI0013009C45|nr:hypothetical protein [Fastidiosibacter lacustris]
MMTLTDIIKHLSEEHDLTFIENQQHKHFAQLKHSGLLINSLIAKANSNYLYVFDTSMANINNTQFDLMSILFTYDALLSIAQDNIVNVDKILGEKNDG